MKIKYSGTDYIGRVKIIAPIWQWFKVSLMLDALTLIPVHIVFSLHWSCLGFEVVITGANKHMLRVYKLLQGAK